MKFRKVYEIKAFTENGDLKFRYFARNKKIAERIKKKKNADQIIDVTNIYKAGLINDKEVEE